MSCFKDSSKYSYPTKLNWTRENARHEPGDFCSWGCLPSSPREETQVLRSHFRARLQHFSVAIFVIDSSMLGEQHHHINKPPRAHKVWLWLNRNSVLRRFRLRSDFNASSFFILFCFVARVVNGTLQGLPCIKPQFVLCLFFCACERDREWD